MRSSAIIILALALVACRQGGGGILPGDTSDTQPFDAIAPGETVHFTGTEPFWGGEVTGGALTYATPENANGREITVKRFAGRGGVSYSGSLGDRSFDLTITPGVCSDGMSDRTYPFVATLRLGDETRNGCAWSENSPFTGPETP